MEKKLKGIIKTIEDEMKFEQEIMDANGGDISEEESQGAGNTNPEYNTALHAYRQLYFIKSEIEKLLKE